jgi:hypothetical protein
MKNEHRSVSIALGAILDYTSRDVLSSQFLSEATAVTVLYCLVKIAGEKCELKQNLPLHDPGGIVNE